MLFSNRPRTDPSPRKYSESFYAHLNRRAGAENDRVRALIESWFSHLPKTSQHEVQQRIYSSGNVAFVSAFLELYIHELLLQTGHDLTIHPELPHTSARPDYKADRIGSHSTIIECVVCTEVSIAERGSKSLLNALYDAIDDIVCPDYFLQLDVIGSPASPIPISKWRARLQSWVDSLCYEELLENQNEIALGGMPAIEFCHDGLDVSIRPIPKNRSARGKEGRPLGLLSAEGCWVTSREDVKRSVKKKATRYGMLSMPYLIVVNCIGNLCDHEEVEAALFGDEGLWPHRMTLLYTRVSGVLVIWHLFPWTTAQADIRLFHNPAAELPYVGALTELPQAWRNESGVCFSEGVHPRDYLQLSVMWPYSEG